MTQEVPQQLQQPEMEMDQAEQLALQTMQEGQRIASEFEVETRNMKQAQAAFRLDIEKASTDEIARAAYNLARLNASQSVDTILSYVRDSYRINNDLGAFVRWFYSDHDDRITELEEGGGDRLSAESAEKILKVIDIADQFCQEMSKNPQIPEQARQMYQGYAAMIEEARTIVEDASPGGGDGDGETEEEPSEPTE